MNKVECMQSLLATLEARLATLEARLGEDENMNDKCLSNPVGFAHPADLKNSQATGTYTPLYPEMRAGGYSAPVYSDEYVQSLLARIAYLEDAIRCHQAGFVVCPVCSNEIPCSTDDVCGALKND